MRTSLEYSVLREEEYDYKTDKLVNRVKSRGFAFCVNGCITKEEHEKVIDDFYSDSTNEEKDFLVEEVENKRNDYCKKSSKIN